MDQAGTVVPSVEIGAGAGYRIPKEIPGYPGYTAICILEMLFATHN